MAYNILALVINKATEVGKTAMKKLKLRNRTLNTKDGKHTRRKALSILLSDKMFLK